MVNMTLRSLLSHLVQRADSCLYSKIACVYMYYCMRACTLILCVYSHVCIYAPKHTHTDTMQICRQIWFFYSPLPTLRQMHFHVTPLLLLRDMTHPHAI